MIKTMRLIKLLQEKREKNPLNKRLQEHGFNCYDLDENYKIYKIYHKGLVRLLYYPRRNKILVGYLKDQIHQEDKNNSVAD